MGQDYIIATASTCDLKREYLEKHNIPFISYSFVMDGRDFADDCREESRQEIYTMMRQGKMLSTSAINMFTYREFFEKLIDEGHNTIIFLDMTSSFQLYPRYFASYKDLNLI